MSSNRRDFIKKTALGAIGATIVSNSANAMTAKSYSKIIGSNDRIHVALQGLGRRYGAYISAIVAKDSNVEISYL